MGEYRGQHLENVGIGINIIRRRMLNLRMKNQRLRLPFPESFKCRKILLPEHLY